MMASPAGISYNTFFILTLLGYPMSASTRFSDSPTPWITSWCGALLFTAMMKLHPTHRQLMAFEMKNICRYFHEDSLKQAQAALLCYLNSIRRVLRLDASARQDYFALNRHGCFAMKEIPSLPDTASNPQHLPMVIVPGLNTPPVYFRKMHEYFSQKGYPVSVLTLPGKGLADVATASQALKDEIDHLQQRYQSDGVNLVGHCLGGLIGQYYLAHQDTPPVKHMISLSTGFLGSKGVACLKDIWVKNHPAATIPTVFDELIHWNMNIAHKAGEVAYHNFATVWDFLVDIPSAVLQSGRNVTNHLIDDADIDHLTIALNPKMFSKIESALASSPA